MLHVSFLADRFCIGPRHAPKLFLWSFLRTVSAMTKKRTNIAPWEPPGRHFPPTAPKMYQNCSLGISWAHFPFWAGPETVSPLSQRKQPCNQGVLFCCGWEREKAGEETGDRSRAGNGNAEQRQDTERTEQRTRTAEADASYWNPDTELGQRAGGQGTNGNGNRKLCKGSSC